MASGTIQGSVSQNSSGYEFYVTWSETVNVAANTSTVTATAYARAKSSAWASDTVNSNFTQKITIDGKSYSKNIRVNIKSDTEPVQLIRYTVTVDHNASGTGTCAILASCHLGTASYSPGYGTASGTITLTPVDRSAPNVSLSVGTPGETSVTFTASANAACDNWAYSLNGGGWVSFSSASTTSVSYTLEGLEPDTAYTLRVRAQKVSNNVYGTSPQQSFTTEPDTPAPLEKFTATSHGSTAFLDGSPVTLSWSGTAGTVTGYIIQYATQPMGGALSAWQTLAEISSSSLSGNYTDNGAERLSLPAGTELIYRIAAVNGDNVSPYKNSNALIRTGGMWGKRNGSWVFGSVWVKQGGSWVRASRIWVNNAGTWTKGG